MAGPTAGYWRGASDCGTRANIDGASAPTVPSSGGVIATVRIQDQNATGLYQYGHIKQGGAFTSDCGTGGEGFMEEWKVAPSGGYNCNYYGGTAYYQNALFTVTRDPNNAQYWRIYLNGNFITQKGPLGFSFGRSFAVSEYNGSGPSNYNERWGPPNITAWQFRSGSPTAAFQDVPTGNLIQDAGSFNVVGGPPRFSLTR